VISLGNYIRKTNIKIV